MAKTGSGANLGFENKLWEMADKMRLSPTLAGYEMT